MNDKLTQRPLPWTWKDESTRMLPIFDILYCGESMMTTNSASAAQDRCDKLNGALAALNGPPAVDLGKVREALAEIDEANDNGGMCYSDKLHRAVQKLRSALPTAPTDHKEPQ